MLRWTTTANAAPDAAALYNQPASVITTLTSGNWCNTRQALVSGLPPTALPHNTNASLTVYTSSRPI